MWARSSTRGYSAIVLSLLSPYFSLHYFILPWETFTRRWSGRRQLKADTKRHDSFSFGLTGSSVSVDEEVRI